MSMREAPGDHSRGIGRREQWEGGLEGWQGRNTGCDICMEGLHTQGYQYSGGRIQACSEAVRSGREIFEDDVQTFSAVRGWRT